MTDRSTWKALADPARRKILDLLRARPRTTGELARAFPFSRFATMKHVAVLSRAGLVVARREGRTRWNHLNAVPLQRIYERWVRPYEAHWAEGLFRLKTGLEAEKGGNVMVEKANRSGAWAGVLRVELEIPIAALQEKVWKALIEDFHLWWRKDFHTSKRTKRMTLEPKVGGRVFEDFGKGEGVLWYTIVGIDAPERLLFEGRLFPAYGGPATTLLELKLVPRGTGTVLQVSDSIFGAVGDGTAKSFKEGWTLLFAEGLKPFIERGRPRR
jgi:DNA-binding transcriptional ArsR family regulator/uncharacterized protein YndB with AHSA1/START domain